MKTFRFLFTIMVCLILASCASDEQKALDYVKTEVMPEETIEQHLFVHYARYYNTQFWNNISDYIRNNVTGRFNKLLPTQGYGHYDEDGRREDYWEIGSANGKIDSQKILQSICDKVTSYIKQSIINNPVDYSQFELGDKTDYDWYNSIITEAAEKSPFYVHKEFGEYRFDAIATKRSYDWLLKSEEEQNAFIDSISVYILAKARDYVRKNDFKLKDSQAIKTSETQFEVFYLLGSDVQIVFDLTKIGNTFSCKSIVVEDEDII